MTRPLHGANRFPYSIFTIPFVTGWLVLSIAGCEGENHEVARYPVSGEIRQNGQPVAEALVRFHLQGDSRGAVPQPVGYTDAQGKFALTTFEMQDGAPVGTYAITVELKAERIIGDEPVRDGPNLLPARYSDPATSKLQFQVEPQENHVPVLEIQTS